MENPKTVENRRGVATAATAATAVGCELYVPGTQAKIIPKEPCCGEHGRIIFHGLIDGLMIHGLGMGKWALNGDLVI